MKGIDKIKELEEQLSKARKEAEEKLCREWSYDNSIKIADEFKIKGDFENGKIR